MTRGVHRVRLGQVPATLVDLSCEVTVASVHHGRDNADGQPEASTATIAVYGPVPDGADIGWSLEVWAGLEPPDAYAQRFAGTVTDISLAFDMGVDPESGRTIVRPYTEITAASSIATLGRQYVGSEPWPDELDGARVRRVLELCGITTAAIDPGTVTILGRDVDRQAALGLLQTVGDDAGGLLVNNRDGRLAYHDAEHRRAAVAALTVDACQIRLTPRWVRDMSGLINEAAIGYGPVPEGGEQAVVTRTSTPSQAVYGRVAYYGGTQLANVTDATNRAGAILARSDRPVWNLTDLGIDVDTLTADELETLLTLELGALVGLTGMPLEAPDPAFACWLEGWSETLTLGGHDLVFAITAYCRTAPFPRWDDMPSSRTWDSMGDLTWDQAVCIGPIVSEGRWGDVSATLYWDDVDATITWDTWPY